MEKSCPAKEDHPPGKFSASVYMRKKGLTPLPDPSANKRARASSDNLALTEVDLAGRAKKAFIRRKAGPAWRVTLPSRNGNPAVWVSILIEPPFCSRVNDSLSLSKCMKRWLSRRRVTYSYPTPHKGGLCNTSYDESHSITQIQTELDLRDIFDEV